MGITKLFTLLNEKCPGATETVSLEEYSGKTLVIDVSNYAYKYISFGLVSGFMRLLLTLRNCYITPVFVFDGAPSELKADTLHKRHLAREARKERTEILDVGEREINAIFRILDTFGATGTTSNGESDPLMAAYVLDNTAAAAISADGDMLAYGVPELITKIDTSGRNCTRVRLDKILENLQLTVEEFRDLCIVLGTDYNRNPPQIGYKRAYSKISDYRTIEAIELHMRGRDPNYSVGFDIARIRGAFSDLVIEETPYKNGPALTLDELQALSSDLTPEHLQNQEYRRIESLYQQLQLLSRAT